MFTISTQYWNFKPFMVDGKSKMYAYKNTWYQTFLHRNKIKLLKYDPQILLMILTCMKQSHHTRIQSLVTR